jgi:chromosome segregation and condensation protein ScpB
VLAAYVSEQNGASGNLQMTTPTLEVLACIAFRQPISQAEIDQLFDADKRGLVVKLRDLKLVEEFAGADGRLRFATTAEFFAALRPSQCNVSDETATLRFGWWGSSKSIEGEWQSYCRL